MPQAQLPFCSAFYTNRFRFVCLFVPSFSLCPWSGGCGLSHEIATALKDADQHVGRACAVLQDHVLEAMGSWPVEVKLQMLQSCPWAWPESPAYYETVPLCHRIFPSTRVSYASRSNRCIALHSWLAAVACVRNV